MIGFTAPWALFGLVAAAFPLLLHLVQRREPREVVFPAVRYLEDATRDQRRRLQLRHLLLLILRTLLIVALVLAAAGATVTRGALGSHAPSALVLVVDNSASSGAVVDGEQLLARLIRAGGEVLDRATPSDRLWLLTADGGAIPGAATELRPRLQALEVSPRRLDLGAAVSEARDLLRSSGLPGEVVVVSDMQQSALSEARGSGPVLVLRPKQDPPANRTLAALVAGGQPWGPDGGRVSVRATAADTAPLPVTLSLEGRRLREVLLTPGVATLQRVSGLTPGWHALQAALPPDEFRLDDERTIALRVAPPATVRWDPTDRFVATALDVLVADGRVRAGDGVRLGSLGPGASVVFPPADPARIGALNRELAARGASWRYGLPTVASGRTDSSAWLPFRELVTRRVTLVPSGAAGEVLATVDGAPWLVRSGDVLLLGSRLDPAWTELPFGAPFVPFLDALLSRASRGEPVTPDVVVGDAMSIPDRVTAVSFDGNLQAVEPGQSWSAPRPGMYLLLSNADTLGALSAGIDPRESLLARAPDAAIRGLWGSVTTADLASGPRRAFAATGRGDLRGPLLFLALCCALTEAAVLGLLRSRTT